MLAENSSKNLPTLENNSIRLPDLKEVHSIFITKEKMGISEPPSVPHVNFDINSMSINDLDANRQNPNIASNSLVLTKTILNQ